MLKLEDVANVTSENIIEKVKNEIVCGDCLEVMKKLPDKCVDLVLTDPPYNVGLDYSDGDKRIDYKEWCEKWFRELQRISKFIIFTPGMVNISMWVQIEEPLWYGSWMKSNQCSPSRLGGFNAWEPLLFYGNILKRIGHDAWNIPIKQQSGVGNHPCPKYLPFWKMIIEKSTNEDMIILDPFLGSGTTAVACKQLNRNFIGIEISRDYCDIAEKRLANIQQTLI
jgi:DNA modification methylase